MMARYRIYFVSLIADLCSDPVTTAMKYHLILSHVIAVPDCIKQALLKLIPYNNECGQKQFVSVQIATIQRITVLIQHIPWILYFYLISIMLFVSYNLPILPATWIYLFNQCDRVSLVIQFLVFDVFQMCPQWTSNQLVYSPRLGSKRANSPQEFDVFFILYT